MTTEELEELHNIRGTLQNQSDEISFLKAENERIRREHIYNSIYAELLEENKQLKKRLENAVELPCKVGNTVYTFSCGSILECYIHKFTVVYENDSNVIYAVLSAKSEEYCGMLNMFTRVKISDFGKTVFLTREEVEKALAERSE